MKKTLYFDKESLDILDKMPPKKQSEYARNAVKFMHKSDMNDTPIEDTQQEIGQIAQFVPKRVRL